MTAIVTEYDGGVSYTAPGVTVKTADTLLSDWTTQDYLWCERIRLACGPDIDSADLLYEYGPQLRHDDPNADGEPAQYDPLELDNKFVRIEIEATVEGESPIVWFGIIEVDELTPDGSDGNVDAGIDDPAGEPAGVQRLTAYGLARLLERSRVYESQLQRAGEFTIDLAAATYLRGDGSGLSANNVVQLSSTGTLPGGFSANTYYYVLNPTLDGGFQLATTPSGSAITATTTGSGTHTWRGGHMQIDHAVAFNGDAAGGQYGRQNRSATSIGSVYSGYEFKGESFLFNGDRRAGSLWTADDAVRYTLKHDAPSMSTVVDVVDWELRDQLGAVTAAALDWADFTVEREGRTPKEILDDLIDRRRGFWYHVDFDEVESKIIVTAGTFADENVTLPSGATLPRNEHLKTLNFEQAWDIESATLRKVTSQTYDTIIVQGAHKTSTATFYFGTDDILIPDWTDAEEEDFREAAAGSDGPTGYSDREREEQFRLNRSHRTDEKLAHVFARFRLTTEWTGRIYAPFVHEDNPTNFYWVWPPLDGDTTDKGDDGEPVPLYNASTNANPGGEIWKQGAVFEPRTRLRERVSYADSAVTNSSQLDFRNEDVDGRDDYLKPLFFCSSGRVNGKVYHEFCQNLGTEFEVSPRKFNVSGRVLGHGPYVELRARPANQLIAKTEWNSKAHGITEPEYDPRESHGLEWESDFFCTLTIRLPERVHRIEKIRTPTIGGVERKLWINVPDKRLDYLVPYTAVGITKGGELQQSTSGGFIRDDRDAIADIATSSAKWFGTTRQTLELTYKQIRDPDGAAGFKLGWLITSIGDNYNIEDVNTVVTAITYDLSEGVPRTTLETSYADLDFT